MIPPEWKAKIKTHQKRLYADPEKIAQLEQFILEYYGDYTIKSISKVTGFKPSYVYGVMQRLREEGHLNK